MTAPTGTTADIVVVGGGILGTVTALRSALGGAGRVVVCDDARRGSASGKSVAVLTSFYPDAAESALALAGIRELELFTESSGRDIGLRRTGVVRLVPHNGADAVADEVERHRRTGGDVRLIGVDDLVDVLPGWRSAGVGAAVFEAGGGWADPARVLAAYRDAAREAGVVFVPRTVLGLRTRAGRIVGVDTSCGPLATSTVVVAAGAWSAAVLADSGFDLDLATRRVQVTAFGSAGTPPLDRVVLDSAQGAWFRPDRGGLLAGLEMAVAAPVDRPADETVRQWYVEMCRERLAARLPADSPAPVMRGGWSGLISMSRDGLPVLDRSSTVDGLFCLTGDSGSSFKTAALLGMRMAEWALSGGAAPDDVAHLGADRAGRPPILSEYGAYNKFATSIQLAREARRIGDPESSTLYDIRP